MPLTVAGATAERYPSTLDDQQHEGHGAIIRSIGKQAKTAGVEFAQANRKGGNHDIWMLDGMMIPIPRHNDIPERTTRDTYRECEPKLGKDWWK